MKHLMTTIWLLGCTSLSVAQAPTKTNPASERVEVTVHPGIELFTVVQVLAGQYPTPNKSTYVKDVERHFGSFTNHPAVEYARKMGRLYTDVAELGYCFDNFPNVRVHFPEKLSWYDRYGRDTVQTYMKLCRQFYDESNFWDFYQQHRADYAAWSRQVYDDLMKKGLVAKLDSFYRFTSKAQWSVYMDPLNSWGAHAIMPKNLNPRYSDRVVYNVGYFNRESKDTDVPVFSLGSESVNLVWHEGSHIYTHNLQQQYAAQIEKLAYLLNKEDAGMARNNISTWSHCFDENLVRGVVIALFRQHLTPKEARKQAAREIVSDFLYAGDIADVIQTRYLNDDKQKDFSAFFPNILAYLTKKYPQSQLSNR